MIKILTRRRAIDDTKTIWKHMSQSDCQNKQEAISCLFHAGKISRRLYQCDCPLCEKYFYKDPCKKCPWPGYKKDGQCLHPASPYSDWIINRTKENASKVYEFVLTFK